MGNLISKPKLSGFQKEKLLHEFKTFYDLDGDGHVTWNDFLVAKEHICKLNGWESGSEKDRVCGEELGSIWDALSTLGDNNFDDRVSSDEWVKLWTDVYKKIEKKERSKQMERVENLPKWCYKYLQHRFHMFDRTGDGIIDAEEFEYVLSHFSVSPTDARKAWMIISEGESCTVDFEKFCSLASEYYFSNDPAALGNFITGKLDFELMEN